MKSSPGTRVGVWLFSAVTALALSAGVASAAKVRLSIVSEPSGANIEWNGRFVGTTPYATEVEDYAIKAPRFLWSNFLNQRIVLRLWKDGYLPKMVELTSGPFVWTNMNNTASKVYFVIPLTDVRVLLERDPSASLDRPDPPPSPTAAVSSTATGTGFILSSIYVATNYHVIRGASQIELRVPGHSQLLPATLVVKDSGNDLAILKAEGLPPAITPIAFAEPSLVKVGQDAFALGFPLGELMGSTVRLSTGSIDSLFGIDDDPRVFQISNPVQPGNSGGPLFNKDGQLIGVVVAQLDAKALYEAAGIIPQNVNFAVKASLLKNLVDTLPEGVQVVAQSNKLQGASREKQVEALTPLVVEIVSHRAAVQTNPDSGGSRRAATALRSIEGYSPDQVRSLLGPPSLRQQDPDGITTWYYDTPEGTLKVFFFNDRASLRRQR